MTGIIVDLHPYPVSDPQKQYYDYEPKERMSLYNQMIEPLMELRERALEPFAKKDKCDLKVWRNLGCAPECLEEQDPAHLHGGLTPEELTEELKQIIPSFDGEVLERRCRPKFFLQYVLSQSDMEKLLGEVPFNNITGKVVTSADGLLAPDYGNLSGYVILQAEQDSPKRYKFILDHELTHSKESHYPNAIRRDQLVGKIRSQEYDDANEYADDLMSLDKSIKIDEAIACMSCFQNDFIPGLSERFKTEFTTELQNSTANMIGMQLDRGRKSGNLDNNKIEEINVYERASMQYPMKLRQAVLNLADKLANPERLEKIGYALSYVSEALIVLDFDEIMDGDTLERFCLEFMEPRRLGGMMRFNL